MNKQELINNVKAWGAWCTDHNTGEKDYYVKIDKVRELAEQLAEQPKVMVPQFVADWFEKNKDDLTFAIYEAVTHSIKEAGYKHYSDEFIGWFTHSDNNSIETLIRMKDGYDVEKEPKFIVKVGNLYLIEPLGDTSDSTIRTTWNHKNAYKFTIYDMAQTHANKFGGEVEEVK
ncbi:DUF1642 domain-containing protein [Enterococcus innesii]|uniref:DUF1642 domain-containing protein n=1 Tax=Enterococcus innesii TaxID=2839759 RepID=UPI003D10298F